MKASTIALLIFSALAFQSANAQGNLTIETAFKLEFDSTPGEPYQIEASADMEDWQRIAVIYASSTRSEYLAEKTAEHQFFRATALPEADDWLQGVWRGDVCQVGGGASDFNAIIRFNNVIDGYHTLFLDLPCGGDLELLGGDESTASFELAITQGSPGRCQNGTVTLKRISPTKMVYRWEHEDGAELGVSIGILTRDP